MGEAHLHPEMLFPVLFCRCQKLAVKDNENNIKAIMIIWGLANSEQDTQAIRRKII